MFSGRSPSLMSAQQQEHECASYVVWSSHFGAGGSLLRTGAGQCGPCMKIGAGVAQDGSRALATAARTRSAYEGIILFFSMTVMMDLLVHSGRIWLRMNARAEACCWLISFTGFFLSIIFLPSKSLRVLRVKLRIVLAGILLRFSLKDDHAGRRGITLTC